MRKILVTEIELPSCNHLRYIWFTLPDIMEKGGYVAIVSFDSFFHGYSKRRGEHGRNWKLKEGRKPRIITRASYQTLYVAHRPDEVFGLTISTDAPHVEVATLWDFYKLIGYDYKKQRWIDPEIPGSIIRRIPPECGAILIKTLESEIEDIRQKESESSHFLIDMRQERLTKIKQRMALDELTAEAQDMGLY